MKKRIFIWPGLIIALLGALVITDVAMLIASSRVGVIILDVHDQDSTASHAAQQQSVVHGQGRSESK